MRVKLNDSMAGIEIILKEEPILYFDESLQFRLRPMGVYYSEKGELAKIKIYKPTEKCGEDNEVIIPDGLPWRKYTYTLDKEIYGCIDSYTDIWNTDDILTSWGRLIIQRRDGRGMDKDEIKGIREDFIKDVSEWLPELLLDDSVISVYKNRKLHFWVTEARMSDRLEFIQDTFEEYLDYENGELKERNIGADLIYPDHQLALICIFDDEYFDEHHKERVVTKEELIDIFRKTKRYENRRIILLDAELSEKAVEYAKSQNIEIQTFIDVVKEKFMEASMLNDDIADTLDLSGIFGDDQEEIPLHNESNADDKHAKSIEYPESSDDFLILKDSNTSKPK